MRYRFGPYLLDTAACELRRGELVLEISARKLALLAYLVKNRDRVVPRDELAEAYSPRQFIGDQSITSRISELRSLLGEAEDGRGVLRTVYGQGVRFVAEVEEEPSDFPDAPPVAGRPSIAVLRFGVLGDADDCTVVAEALPDEIITGLAKLRWLFVIARGSAFRFTSHERAVEDIGRRLQVRYCLSGTMEKIGATLRIGVELADTHDGRIVWSERYDMPSSQIHRVREEVSRRIVSELNLQIPEHEIDRVRHYEPSELDSWQLFHRGLGLVMGADIDRFPEARSLFEASLNRDPGFARARAGLANTLFLETLFRRPDAAEVSVRGQAEANRALQLDPRDPYCMLMHARMHFNAGAFYDGMAELEKTISASPSYSIAHSDKARMLAVAGDVEGARGAIDTALALNPIDPYNHTSYITLSLIEMLDGNFEEAAAVARAGQKLSFRSLDDRIVSIAAFHYGDDRKAAANEAERLKASFPDLDLDTYLAPIPLLQPEIDGMIRTMFATYQI